MITFSATLTCCYDTPFSPYSAADFEQGLQWLAQSGFDSAELTINDYEHWDGATLRQALARHRLGCTTIATGQARKRDGLSLLALDASVVKRTQQRLYQHIDAAAQLDSFVTVGSLRVAEQNLAREAYMHQLAASLQPCLDYARRQQVTLVVEALNRYEASHLHHAEDMRDFIQLIDEPDNIGVLWDIFHANIEDPDYAKAISTLGKWLRHVHYADSNRGFPGYGHLPIEEIYRALKAANYQGAISLECYMAPTVKTVIDEAGPLIARLRGLSLG
ncbi:sugar phosphate isomerase/epimerase family protein [Biostraticola tofi]|uniref:Sugar phosphate isomerase/epimerase n=1 Tax=Biostraticola tofi TaxID=466109 RepID=A0A4R3Z154_9GAMM|nr:sugar phosphate isomerase/epimerase family protein [Biostraticola tofi]TCV98711.1 sugar phosphate isomerase/epimerase [Biostraticola tofi]